VGIPLTSGPNAHTAMKRILILRHQVTKAIITPPHDLLAPAMKQWSSADRAAFLERSKEMNERQIVYLRTSGLWPLMTPAEQEFAEVTFQDTTPQQRADALWAAESAGVLMWALGLIASMAPYDAQFDLALLKLFPQEGAPSLVDSTALRPQADISRARAVAELWHWRARTTQLQKEHGGSYRVEADATLDDIVRAAAHAAYAKGDIPSPIGDDFPAHTKAYRDLTDGEWSQIMSIAVERHKALNWLCGYAPGNLWDATPTDT
jgi:hypothetical protein